MGKRGIVEKKVSRPVLKVLAVEGRGAEGVGAIGLD